MPDVHLANIEEQQVEHKPLDTQNDKLTRLVGCGGREAVGSCFHPIHAVQ